MVCGDGGPVSSCWANVHNAAISSTLVLRLLTQNPSGQSEEAASPWVTIPTGVAEAAAQTEESDVRLQSCLLLTPPLPSLWQMPDLNKAAELRPRLTADILKDGSADHRDLVSFVYPVLCYRDKRLRSTLPSQDGRIDLPGGFSVVMNTAVYVPADATM